MKYRLLFVALFLFINQYLPAQVDSTFSSPHAVIYNHLYYLQPDHFDPGQAALSFNPQLEGRAAIKYATKLKQILDGRGLYVYMSQIPEDPNYKDTLYQKNIYYLFPKELPQLFVQKVDKRWMYGEETVKAIPELHRKTYPFGTDYLLKLVPQQSSKKFLGLDTWQYLGILALFVLAALLFLFLRLIFKPILRKISQLSFHIDFDNQKLLNRTSHLLSLFFVFLLVKYIFPVLQLPVKWTLFTKRGIDIILTVFIALIILRVMDFVIAYFKTLADKTESKMDDQLLPIVSQIFKLVVIIGALIQILHLINVNVTALIAGISIGGLALALAAKDTVSNLIGSLMVFMDKPFQIGDYIEVGSYGGTVKEVGFRSTRIQTKDTSVISIPNGNIANTALVNKGIRVYRLFETTLGVAYDTPPDLIEVFVSGLKKLILDHSRVSNEGYYINLSALGASSLDIHFRVYLDTTDYGEELAIKEDLILAILRMAESIGVRFAFPSTTVYVEQFPGQKDLIPEYSGDKKAMEEKLEEFFKNKQNNGLFALDH
jgi:MscS family membrane protein